MKLIKLLLGHLCESGAIVSVMAIVFSLVGGIELALDGRYNQGLPAIFWFFGGTVSAAVFLVITALFCGASAKLLGPTSRFYWVTQNHGGESRGKVAR